MEADHGPGRGRPRQSRSHPKPGLHPSPYGVAFDSSRKVYEVTLTDFE